MRLPYPVLLILFTGSLFSQTGSDDSFSQSISMDVGTVPPTFTYSWWGKFEAHYIVQVSTDLHQPWLFLSAEPTPELNPSGADATLSIHFETTAERVFFRAIQFHPASPITLLEDIDDDGLPDLWEIFYFGNLSREETYDPDGDGITALDAYALGLDPRVAHDNEGDLTHYSYSEIDQFSAIRPVNGPEISYNPDSVGNIEP